MCSQHFGQSGGCLRDWCLSLLSQSVDGTSILFWKLQKAVDYQSNTLEWQFCRQQPGGARDYSLLRTRDMLSRQFEGDTANAQRRYSLRRGLRDPGISRSGLIGESLILCEASPNCMKFRSSGCFFKCLSLNSNKNMAHKDKRKHGQTKKTKSKIPKVDPK